MGESSLNQLVFFFLERIILKVNLVIYESDTDIWDDIYYIIY